MKYPDMIEYITSLFSVLDEFLTTQENVSKSGRPQKYPDASLIVFYAVMTLKGITAMRAQQDYLFQRPFYLQRCRLPRCPSHVILGRRYKALTPTLQALLNTLLHGASAIVDTSRKKSFMKIRVCSKRRIPSGIRGIASTMRYPQETYAVLIQQPLGRKVGIMAGSMDTNSISPPPTVDFQ